MKINEKNNEMTFSEKEGLWCAIVFILQWLKQIGSCYLQKPNVLITWENLSEIGRHFHVNFFSAPIEQKDIFKIYFPILVQLNSPEKFGVIYRDFFGRSIFYEPLSRKKMLFSKMSPLSIKSAMYCSVFSVPLPKNWWEFLKMTGSFFKKPLCVGLILGWVGTFLSVFTVLISGYLLSSAKEAQSATDIYFIAFALGFFIFYGLFSLVRDLYYQTLCDRTLFFIFPALAYRLFFAGYSAAGDMVERFLEYEKLFLIFFNSFFSVFLNGVALLWLFLYMTFFDVKIACFYMLLALIFLTVKSFLFFKGCVAKQAELTAAGKISAFLIPIFSALLKIRSAAIENIVCQKWVSEVFAKQWQEKKRVMIEIISEAIDRLFPLAVATIFCLIIYLLNVAGSYFALLQTFMISTQFSIILEKLSQELQSFFYNAPVFHRMTPFLSTAVESVKPLAAGPGKIEFQHVSLQEQENDEYRVQDISLVISPGECVALTGPSGCGKSTIFRLLLGLEKPSGGKILIDQNNFQHIDTARFRQTIGVVLQTTAILPGTIFSNIAMNTTLSLQDAWHLVEVLGFAKEVHAMPMKLFTRVSGDAGSSLSGGQKQKILLARALATKPKILLLDEATSALDNESEAKVQAYLSSLSITRFVIAHRPSTLQYCDRFYKMEAGRIVAQNVIKK